MSAQPLVPPLPDPNDMLPISTWAKGRVDLPRHAAYWFTKAHPERERLARKAKHLAAPSLGRASLAALARTGGRVLTTVGPAGLAEIFQTATDVRRAKDGKELKNPDVDARKVAIEHAQRLVEAGGPAYVKLGQFIASAKGLLPDEWVEAFAWCRDEVPPLKEGVAESIIKHVFERPVDEIFASFDPTPIGSASIAQVHAATLHDGTEVVVKVRRPGLRKQFSTDIRVMALLASVAERLVPEARMGNLSGFVELFAQIVLEELDFRLEAVNIMELGLASESAGHDYANFPRPIADLVAANVLVMERVPGVRYTDAMERYPGKLDGDKLLRLAITSVLEHTLIFGRFHGDLHAGNVFIDETGKFSLVDFGIVGRLTADQRAALIRFMIGFASDDVGAQLYAMREFGAVPPDADMDALIATVQVEADKLSQITDIRVGQISQGLDELADAMGKVLRALARSGFVLPKELVIFFKNLLYLNGFAAALAPDVNLLAEIEPIFTYFATKY
ncbi:MAG: AarF/UbiB family protein, partial [Actinomycetota bacterium]